MRKTECSLTPEKAVQILRKHGTNISIGETKLILNFMENFIKLAINQIVVKNNQSL